MTVFIKKGWAAGGDSLKMQTASSVLTGKAGARIEHRILSGAG